MPWHKDVESEGYSETPREGVNLRRIGGGGYMDLVSNVWHWHAVEWGGRCKLNSDFACLSLRGFCLFFSPALSRERMSPDIMHSSLDMILIPRTRSRVYRLQLATPIADLSGICRAK